MPFPEEVCWLRATSNGWVKTFAVGLNNSLRKKKLYKYLYFRLLGKRVLINGYHMEIPGLA